MLYEFYHFLLSISLFFIMWKVLRQRGNTHPQLLLHYWELYRNYAGFPQPPSYCNWPLGFLILVICWVYVHTHTYTCLFATTKLKTDLLIYLFILFLIYWIPIPLHKCTFVLYTNMLLLPQYIVRTYYWLYLFTSLQSIIVFFTEVNINFFRISKKYHNKIYCDPHLSPLLILLYETHCRNILYLHLISCTCGGTPIPYTKQPAYLIY